MHNSNMNPSQRTSCKMHERSSSPDQVETQLHHFSSILTSNWKTSDINSAWLLSLQPSTRFSGMYLQFISSVDHFDPSPVCVCVCVCVGLFLVSFSVYVRCQSIMKRVQ
ncbi:uncharacterized protein V6R79_002383 [Siganus canaliculatus]